VSKSVGFWSELGETKFENLTHFLNVSQVEGGHHFMYGSKQLSKVINISISGKNVEQKVVGRSLYSVCISYKP
jgi:hypothetical protein